MFLKKAESSGQNVKFDIKIDIIIIKVLFHPNSRFIKNSVIGSFRDIGLAFDVLLLALSSFQTTRKAHAS